MKKFLGRLLLFSFCLSLLLLGLHFFQKKYNRDPPHYALHYQELYQAQTKSNAIIIGASHAVHGIRPALLNSESLQFYNFALNGAGPKFYEQWYKKIFSKEYPKPAVCLYAVDWFMFNEAWLWRSFEVDSEYFSWTLFQECLFDQSFNPTTLVYNRIAFLKYRKQLLDALRLNTENRTFPVKDYDRGFIPFYTPFKAKNFVYEDAVEDLIHAKRQQDAFVGLVKRMQEEGIQVIFVLPPEYQLDEKVYQSEGALYLEALATSLEIPYLNFNTKLRDHRINDEQNNFSDWGHLNAQGSITFSQKLKKALAQLLQE